MREVKVIGAGVSGLTSALRLLEAGYDVTILTREETHETTSSVAAALWYPFRAFPLERVIEWSLGSLARLRELESIASSGVRTRPLRELWRSAPPAPGWRESLEGFETIDMADLPPGFLGGYRMRVPVIDSSLYLPYLRGEIERLGGRVEIRHVSKLTELARGGVVVNCSGTGARELVNDPEVFPIRGQVVRTASGTFDEVTVDEGSEEAAYIVPRVNDCVLGTTIEEGSWDRTPSESSTAAILGRCSDLDARAGAVEVIEARVGLRPGRSSVRVELERLPDGVVVHNYGHGGSGFTLSWGCAEDVARLVENADVGR